MCLKNNLKKNEQKFVLTLSPIKLKGAHALAIISEKIAKRKCVYKFRIHFLSLYNHNKNQQHQISNMRLRVFIFVRNAYVPQEIKHD